MLKSYPAKVLLLGEYTILSGSRALAIPYHKLSGHWSYEPITTEAGYLSRKSLQAFLKYDSSPYVNHAALSADIDKGLWFDSNIPHGFGLGSSGALVAAIYDAYGINKSNLLSDKKSLARLEDYFHGSSSGLDPLVSYLEKPLHIHDFDRLEVLNETPDLSGFFLVNTGKPRQTGPLVKIYKEKLKDTLFNHGCTNVLSLDVNFAIDALLKGDRGQLFHHLWHISKFQNEFFAEMIPDEMRRLWTKGLESGDYILKLCGAGGGGFLLGYSNKIDLHGVQSILEHELKDLK